MINDKFDLMLDSTLKNTTHCGCLGRVWLPKNNWGSEQTPNPRPQVSHGLWERKKRRRQDSNLRSRRNKLSRLAR
jgi:hypothetical protein